MRCMRYSFVTVLCLISFILEVTNGLPALRACIIGAGYSGLAAARHMKDYGVHCKLFEATKDVGGNWRFDPHIGTDEDGLPIFSSMYKNLRANIPHQTMDFSRFPFPEGTHTYISGSCYHKYMKSFVKNFNLHQLIQYRSFVTSVKWAGDHWNITYNRTDTKESITEPCDFMVIASGHYSVPKWPQIKGIETFKGNMTHSHDYKEPKPFTNRRVLLVGAGASGLDITRQLCNVTSKFVHSHHLVYNEPKFCDGYVRKPDIMEITPTGAIFKDGTFEEVDDFLFCTGYNYDLPFLKDDIGITPPVAAGKFVLPLYKQIVNIKHPSMTFIGFVKGVILKNLELQAEYTAALASGKFELPSQEDMLKSWHEHVNHIRKIVKKTVDVNYVSDMSAYSRNLTQEAGVVQLQPVITKIRDFNNVNRLDDILNYRDYEFKIIDDYHYQRWYNPRQNLTCPIKIF